MNDAAVSCQFSVYPLGAADLGAGVDAALAAVRRRGLNVDDVSAHQPLQEPDDPVPGPGQIQPAAALLTEEDPDVVLAGGATLVPEQLEGSDLAAPLRLGSSCGIA